MKNPIFILLAITIVGIVGMSVYNLAKSPSQSNSVIERGAEMMIKEQPTNLMVKENEVTVNDEEVEMSANKLDDSRYVQYSKSVLDNTSTNRRVLFFYASWCPTCKSAEENFTQNLSKIPADMTLIRVNYNDSETDQEEKELAKKYGITYQHTFVQIDQQRKEVSKWNGGQINELLANTQ